MRKETAYDYPNGVSATNILPASSLHHYKGKDIYRRTPLSCINFPVPLIHVPLIHLSL